MCMEPKRLSGVPARAELSEFVDNEVEEREGRNTVGSPAIDHQRGHADTAVSIEREVVSGHKYAILAPHAVTDGRCGQVNPTQPIGRWCSTHNPGPRRLRAGALDMEATAARARSKPQPQVVHDGGRPPELPLNQNMWSAGVDGEEGHIWRALMTLATGGCPRAIVSANATGVAVTDWRQTGDELHLCTTRDPPHPKNGGSRRTSLRPNVRGRVRARTPADQLIPVLLPGQRGRRIRSRRSWSARSAVSADGSAPISSRASASRRSTARMASGSPRRW